MAQFPELARFLRNHLDGHEISAAQLGIICQPVHPKRHYDVLAGRRAYTGWEASLVAQRLGVTIPWRYLRGEDRFGQPVKDRALQLALFQKERRR